MYRIHRSDYDNLTNACKVVEQIVNIPLEVQVCKKIIARDVNNYINIISDDNIKFKGCFEIDRDYHKNHSKRIVPIALGEYFINNKPIEKTIFEHIDIFNTNSNNISDININNKLSNSFYENFGIYDFCIGAKMKGQNELVQRYWKGHDLMEDSLSKMNRYYISNVGVELIKKLPPLEKHFLTETDKYKLKHDPNQINMFDFIDDIKIDAIDRDENLESGYKCTIFNTYKEYDYDLNYDYYINECNKIIDKLK